MPKWQLYCLKAIELLQQKNLAELEEIAWCVNRTGVQLLPEGDPQCRQSLIDALVANLLAKNIHPLALQYLCRRYVIVQEASFAEVQRQEPSAQATETSPGVEEVDQRQEPSASWAENSPSVDVDRAQEPIIETVETSPPVSVEQVQEAHELEEPIIEEHFDIEELFQLETADCPACGGISSLYGDWSREYAYGFWTVRCQKCYSNCIVDELPPWKLDEDEDDDADSENSLGVEVDSVEEAIASSAETSDGVGIARRKEPLIETVKTSPGVKTEATAICPAAKNPILTGLTFSDRFLARYAPPQPEIIHFQSDADGQLSLLDFEVQSVDEPPDPDDFESLDAFGEALACWDWEHNEVSPEHKEPLQVSLDSFSLWGLCPADWYESVALLEPSSRPELSQTCKSSITSDFFIPTFDRLSDRSDKSDEPPDTGVFAKLPKPKPPRFSPATVGQVRAKLRPNSAQTPSKRIPNASQTHTCCIGSWQ